MPHRLTARTLGALLLLASLPAAAEPAEPDRWEATGELGLALARGNSRSENLNGKFTLSHEDSRWKNRFKLSALRAKGEVSGDFDGDGTSEKRFDLSANRYEASAASALRFDARRHLSGSARYEHDDFSAYSDQSTVALGYGHQLLDGERTRLLAEIGPGYRRAREAETGQVHSSLISRGMLDLSHRLTDNSKLSNTLLVESGQDNTFVQNDLGVSVAMNERFALKAGLQARHNSHVDSAAGERRTDTLTTVNLVYSFL
jgi:putative salt-induced outer membrane protein